MGVCSLCSYPQRWAQGVGWRAQVVQEDVPSNGACLFHALLQVSAALGDCSSNKVQWRGANESWTSCSCRCVRGGARAGRRRRCGPTSCGSGWSTRSARQPPDVEWTGRAPCCIAAAATAPSTAAAATSSYTSPPPLPLPPPHSYRRRRRRRRRRKLTAAARCDGSCRLLTPRLSPRSRACGGSRAPRATSRACSVQRAPRCS
jgi:hypothetical protein